MDGVSPSPPAGLSLAGRRLALAMATPVRFEVADAVALPTAGGYDLVFCVEMPHDTSDPVASWP